MEQQLQVEEVAAALEALTQNLHHTGLHSSGLQTAAAVMAGGINSILSDLTPLLRAMNLDITLSSRAGAGASASSGSGGLTSKGAAAASEDFHQELLELYQVAEDAAGECLCDRDIKQSKSCCELVILYT